MKNVRMGSSLLTNLPLLHCNFQELSKIEHKAIMLFFVPIVFILWGISNPLNAQRCMAPDPIVFENSPTLCQKNNDFDADITISGVKYLSNLGYTTWPYGQSDFVSKDIEINGVLIIDQPAAFVFSRVKMGPGARIIVWDEGDELLSYFTDFFACTKMWMGIEFIRNSVGQIYYSNIEDAQYAIHMGSESDVSLYINRFNRNYVSVKNRSEGTNGASMNFILFARNTFDCTSALLLGYTGQAPAPEEISLAGIELNNASMTISAPHAPNVFKRLSHGALLDQSLFAINGAIFESMEEFSTFNSNLYENSGAGIYAENSVVVIADVTFQDNDQEGILTEGSSLDVRHAKFIENRFGCFCWNNGTAEQIQIEQCIFNNNVTGIAAQRPICGVVNAVGLKIHDNAFYRNGIGVRETLPGEIYVNSFGLSIDICEITNNDITIENIDSPVGIFIYGSRGENQRIANNNIDLINVGFVEAPLFMISGGVGIYHFPIAGNLELESNFVNASGTSSGQFFTGALLGRGEDKKVCGNVFNNFPIGMQFVGPSAASTVGQNHFGSHSVGLNVRDLDAGTFFPGLFGRQIRRQNEWDVTPNAYDIAAAWNSASSTFLDQSRMVVPVNVAAENPSQVIPASGWFVPQNGAPDPCFALAPGSVSGFDSLIIGDSTSLYNSATWYEKYILMSKLLINENLRSQHLNFFNLNIDSSFSQFAIVDTLLHHSFIEIKEGQNIFLQEDLVNSLNKSIALIDSLIYSQIDTINFQTPDSLINVRQILVDSIQLAKLVRDSMLVEFNMLLQTNLSSTRSFNDQISVTRFYEQSHGRTNSLLLQKMLGVQFGSNEFDELQDIANSCLEEAGFAIYSAINLLPLCEYENYNDVTKHTCVRSSEVLTETNSVIDIYPNPSIDGNVNLRSQIEGSGLLEIFSIEGIKIFSRQLKSLSEVQLNLNLPDGSYLWLTTLNSGEMHSGKLLIIKD